MELTRAWTTTWRHIDVSHAESIVPTGLARVHHVSRAI
jgi:hypothetical protein